MLTTDVYPFSSQILFAVVSSKRAAADCGALSSGIRVRPERLFTKSRISHAVLNVNCSVFCAEATVAWKAPSGNERLDPAMATSAREAKSFFAEVIRSIKCERNRQKGESVPSYASLSNTFFLLQTVIPEYARGVSSRYSLYNHRKCGSTYMSLSMTSQMVNSVGFCQE